MSCDAELQCLKEPTCACPRCDAHRQRLERKQQLRTLYALPIYQLPPELILAILDKLDLIVFPAMIIGMFHLLRHHGIAPAMTTTDLKLFLKCSNPSRLNNDTGPKTTAARGFYSLPMEIRLEVYRHLSAREKISFVLATFEIPREDIEAITHWQAPPVRKVRKVSLRGDDERLGLQR